VAVGAGLGHEPVHHGLEVLDQRALELVHEERTGGVQRIDEHDAFGDVGAQHDVADLLGDVENLGPLVTQHRQRLPHHL
jgi:hypothetical protein